MLTALLVMVGGALGAPARFWLDAAVGRRLLAWFRAGTADDSAQRRLITRIPWGTAVVNVGGSLVLGAVAAAVAAGASGDVGALLGTGACGAFTTFSTLSVETARLIEEDRPGTALGYALGSGIVGVLAAACGWAVASALI